MLDLTPTAAEQFDRVRELQRRRLNPPNGNLSTELDIVSEPIRRQQRFAAIEQARQAERELREEIIQAALKAQWERAARAKLAQSPSHSLTTDDLKIKRRIMFREIVLAVSEFYNVSVLDILSPRRQARVVKPRQIICYLAKELTTLSLPQIGNHMAGRDHTTVLHAVRKVTGWVMADRELNDEIEYVRAILCGR